MGAMKFAHAKSDRARNKVDAPAIAPNREVMPMPKYFFHLQQSNGDLIVDEDGCEMSGPDQVRSEVVRCGRELWGYACRNGVELMVEAFVIADEDGRPVMSVSLTDALPELLRRATKAA
jgi:hypothetical protein